ncbi:pore-forming ESAT-6 family protein [Falsirhodobacter sp. 20TX0035]|uniref:pore-forming ESAT-6 family protein n=1 Tax=Falsirhodobacter sp. 20TX0035 TaxID=3022019 RepID=UPI00232AF7B8|nr:pore-forming ESAT-6 family protein [Falsirhodobacter sp. 20TX0035]MDB6453554.1 pore-forming ESAT-6 family protein [Falsirhodobacter sp. 20TX0035]
MTPRNLLAALVATPLLAGAALAQDAPAAPQMSMEDAYAAAQNQLGVLEYCQTKATVGNEVIATQTRLMGMIPPPSDTTEAIDAYQKGKTGTVSSMGQEVALADVAQQRSTSEESLCQQMAQLVTQAGEQIPPG